MLNRSRLSDNQRRVVCRLAFLVLCLLPASTATYFIFHRPGPAVWEKRIQAQLGIKTRIESVVTPLPDCVVLRGIEIVDPDSGISARLQELTVVRHPDGHDVMLVEPVIIPADALANLLARCSDQLEQSDLGSLRWRITFGKLSILDPVHGLVDFMPAILEVRKLDSSIRLPDASSIQAKLIARPASQPDSLIEFELEKTPSHDFVAIHTNDAALPCHLFRPWHEDVSFLGAGCGFQGTIELQVNRKNKVGGQIRGDLKNVQLDGIAALLEQPLTGVCDLESIHCNLVDSLIDSASFHVASRSTGSIGRVLLDAAIGLGIETEISANQQVVPFGNLAFDVQIEQGELALAGQEIPILRNGATNPELAPCIAKDPAGLPLMICDNKKSVPLMEVAVLLAGESKSGNLSIAFMDRFRIPAARMAQTEQQSSRY